MKLVKGYMYRIQTLTGAQKLKREHLMTYMDENVYGKLLFNARPFAGTQELDPDDIVGIVPVRPSADTTVHYMNKVIHD